MIGMGIGYISGSSFLSRIEKSYVRKERWKLLTVCERYVDGMGAVVKVIVMVM